MQISAITERELVERSKRGDHLAFEEIVRRHLSPVIATGYALTGDFSRSEDLAQEVFLTAWQRMRDLREPGKLRSWLCAIARNVAYAVYRRESKDALLKASNVEESAGVPHPAKNPAELAAQKERQRQVWAAIEQIPENYRVPLVLYYHEGQSAREVADALDLTEEAVRQRLSRARTMLRHELMGQIEETLGAMRTSPVLVPAIMAAIGGLSISSSAAGVLAAGAKISTTGAAAGAGIMFGALLGPVLGVAGGVLGFRQGLGNAKCPQERAILKRIILVGTSLMLAWLLLLLATIYAGTHKLLPQRPAFFLMMLEIVFYVVVLTTTLVRTRRRIAQARTAAGIPAENPQTNPFQYAARQNPRQWFLTLLFSYGGSIYGACTFLLVLSAKAETPAWFFGILAATTVLVAVGVWRSIRRPENYLLHMGVIVLSVSIIYMASHPLWSNLTTYPTVGSSWGPAPSWSKMMYPTFIILIPLGLGPILTHFWRKRRSGKPTYER